MCGKCSCCKMQLTKLMDRVTTLDRQLHLPTTGRLHVPLQRQTLSAKLCWPTSTPVRTILEQSSEVLHSTGHIDLKELPQFDLRKHILPQHTANGLKDSNIHMQRKKHIIGLCSMVPLLHNIHQLKGLKSTRNINIYLKGSVLVVLLYVHSHWGDSHWWCLQEVPALCSVHQLLWSLNAR